MSERAPARERRAQARRAARLRARPGRGDGRRARGPRERLQHDGRRAQGARQAPHHLRQVHDVEPSWSTCSPARCSLGGETLTVTILFTDIRSFTTHQREDGRAGSSSRCSTSTSPRWSSIVMSEDGVVDKYIGDAIMAVFGAPGAQGRRRRATPCAPRCGCARRSHDLNERLADARAAGAAHRHRHPHGRGRRRQHRQREAHGVHGHRRRGEPRLAPRDEHQGARRRRAHQRRHLPAREGPHRGAPDEGDHGEGARRSR